MDKRRAFAYQEHYLHSNLGGHVKKSIKILIVLVSLPVIGFLGLFLVESQLEVYLARNLERSGIVAQNVDYELFSGKLDLQFIDLDWRTDFESLTGTINQISATSFNLRSLWSGRQDLLPRVADTISVDGADLLFAQPGNGLAADLAFEELYVEGWRQNLGNLAAALDPAQPASAFFEQLLSYRVEVLALRGPELRWQVSGSDLPGRYVADFLGLLGPAGSNTASPQAGRHLSLFANNLSVLTPGLEQYFAARFEIHDLLLPSAAELAKLADKPLYLGASSMLSPEQIARITPLGDLLDRAYAGTLPYQTIVLENAGSLMPLAPDFVLEIWFERITQNHEFGPNLVLNLELGGLHSNLGELDPDYAQVGGDSFADLAFSLKSEVCFDRQASSRLSLSGGVPDLLAVDLEAQIAVQADSLGQLLSYPNFLKQALWLKDLRLEADFDGALDLWCKYLMLAGNLDLDGVRQAIEQAAAQKLGKLGALAQPLSSALAELLREPGLVQAQITAPSAVPWPVLGMALYLNPDQVGFSLTVTD